MEEKIFRSFISFGNTPEEETHKISAIKNTGTAKARRFLYFFVLWQFAFTGEKTEKYLLLYTYSTVIFRLFIKKTAEFFQCVFFNAGNVGATDGKLPGNCFLSFLRSSEQTVPEADDLVFPGR